MNPMLPDRSPGQPVARREAAFSLIEVLVVMTLLALIVFALMSVFSSTQRAFRASVTQVDVLEGSRAAMELITTDLRRMSASGVTNGVNFFASDYSTVTPYYPLQQTLPGSSFNRVNTLDYFFMLSRDNTKWIGVGYAVNQTNPAALYTLYRFYAETNISNAPLVLYNSFVTAVYNGWWTNSSMHPVLDGVMHLVVRPYDVQGIWMTNGYAVNMLPPTNSYFYGPYNGEVQFFFQDNTLPASVELQMAVLEDHIRARAQSLPTFGAPNDRRTQYLQSQAGSLHVFRQQVNIENVDRSVYPQ